MAISLAMFSLVNCGGEEAQQGSQEQEEPATTTASFKTNAEETTLLEETTGVALEETAGETTGGSGEVPPSAVSCTGFGPQFGAQQFFDSKATPEQRAALDPEGDGFACSQGRPASPTQGAQTPPRNAEEAAADEAKKKAAQESKSSFGQQSPQEKAKNTITAYEADGQVDTVECQLAKAQLDLGEEGTVRLLDEWSETGALAPENVEKAKAYTEENGVRLQDVPPEVKGLTLPQFLAEQGYQC